MKKDLKPERKYVLDAYEGGEVIDAGDELAEMFWLHHGVEIKTREEATDICLEIIANCRVYDGWVMPSSCACRLAPINIKE